jgi:hypothetical protein
MLGFFIQSYRNFQKIYIFLIIKKNCQDLGVGIFANSIKS